MAEQKTENDRESECGSSDGDEDSSPPTPLSIGPDGLNRHERANKAAGEAAEAIARDDTLDEPAKIDALAKCRNWFHGDTKVIDAYMAGEIDVAAAVAELAEPIDAEYSTADHGRALWRTERGARIQRTYHSPEKALELWGPQQDFPEPEGDEFDSPGTEMRLWDLWYGVLHAAKRIPWTDNDSAQQEQQRRRLVALVAAFQARPDPPPPDPLPVPLRRDWVWERGTLWSELIMLGPSTREAWNDGCGCGAGWTAPEQHAWTSVNAFVAHLVATSGTRGTGATNRLALLAIFANNFGAAAISAALEQKMWPWQHRPAPLPTQLGLLLAVAAAWVAVAGERMFELRCDDEVPADAPATWEGRGDALPWHLDANKVTDKSTFCTARWKFWRRRFDEEAHNEELPEEARELAAKSAARIQGLLENS
ncbi:hypothetical protein SLS62_001800 [Diatrype stigma]|uniref:Uncharacterized protein n=1 Tax=Diatrype stigma TaxID=117547 RepID=A0AAN9UZG7_9PEZI